jgi:hypothetical protein
MTRCEKICAFIEHYCLIPEGAQVGQPIKLVKFQRKFILGVFDSLHGTSWSGCAKRSCRQPQAA